MPTKDKAAEIAASEYPPTNKHSTGDEDCYNARLRIPLERQIRAAIRDETKRCIGLIQEMEDDDPKQWPGTLFGISRCLAAKIKAGFMPRKKPKSKPTPKPKRKARK